MMRYALSSIAALLLVWVVPRAGVAAEDAGSPPASSAETAPAPAAPQSGATDESIARDLKAVEANVNALKEKVFRSKARLLLLEEKVIQGATAGARAILTHVNDLGPAFVLESVTCFFDGTNVFEQSDPSGEFSKKKEIKIFEGNIPPGNHTITVNMVVRGNGSGAFPYLKDYSFKGQNSYSFVAEDGKSSSVRIVVLKKGGPLAGFEEGPEIRFDLATEKTAAAGGAGAPRAAK